MGVSGWTGHSYYWRPLGGAEEESVYAPKLPISELFEVRSPERVTQLMKRRLLSAAVIAVMMLAASKPAAAAATLHRSYNWRAKFGAELVLVA